MSDQNAFGKGLLIGLLAGGTVGAVIALLYAPTTGKELRGQIKQKSGEIVDDVEEYLHEAQVKAKRIINEGKEKSATLVQEARTKAEGLLRDAEVIMTDARSRIADEGSKLKTAVKAGVQAYKQDPNAPENA